MTLLFIVACGLILHTSFCRLVQMDRFSAQLSARFAFVALASASAYGAVSAALWGYVPGAPGAAIASAVAVVQVIASRAWRRGVPAHFRG